MLLDIGRRYGVDLGTVPMASDTLRDLLAAQAAGCEPHLVLTGRAAALDDAAIRHMLQQVPAARVHADLPALVDFLLERDHMSDSDVGSLD
jgi:D-glycero-D-manno-heptose 1,7-bisphosphate phosphatase